MIHGDIKKSHVTKIILHILTKYILHARDRDMPPCKEYAHVYHCCGTSPTPELSSDSNQIKKTCISMKYTVA